MGKESRHEGGRSCEGGYYGRSSGRRICPCLRNTTAFWRGCLQLPARTGGVWSAADGRGLGHPADQQCAPALGNMFLHCWNKLTNLSHKAAAGTAPPHHSLSKVHLHFPVNLACPQHLQLPPCIP